MAENQAPSLVGRQVGPYKIHSLLGVGGMGEVYLAQDPRLDRDIALKILPTELASDPDRIRRFIREARAASGLKHPNVATIYEIGQSDEFHFIAMEYVEGQTLASKINGRPLPIGEIVDIGIQVADALDEAHRKGITHRDIKPANLMLTSREQVKILDFGLAKITLPEGQALGSDISTVVKTETGLVMGTAQYMSPEQVLGKEVDHRTDIFSLGVVLYEMATGRLPFSGTNSNETMDRILHAQPEAIARFNYNVPAELDRMIRKCLEKDRERRYQSARDLLIDLKNKRGSESGVPVPTRRKVGPVGIAAVLAALIALAGLLWWRNRPAQLSRGFVLTRLTSDSGLTTDPALSPDGKLIAYASDRGGESNLDIWRQQLTTGEAIRLTNDPSDESEPAFSPDGSRIAFRSERDGGGIYVVSAFGGEARLIAKHGRRPRFSPDGTHIAYWIGQWYMGKSFVAPSVGGTPAPIQPDFASALYPIWSPDGKHLLFLGARGLQDIPADSFDWWIAPWGGGPAVKTEAFSIFRRQSLTEGKPSLVAPADWVDDQVFFSAKLGDITSVWRLSVSPRTVKRAGLAQQLTSGTSVEAKPSVSSGDRIVFASLTQNLNIWSLPIEANRARITGEVQKLTHGAFDAHTSLSADGKKLVFTSTRSGNPDVWMKDLATGKETALMATPLSEEQPEITADGTRVCYVVVEGQTPNIYEINLNGGVPEKLCEDCIRPWDWSPDERKILYLLGEGRGNRPQSRVSLGLLDVATRQKTDYLEHPLYNLARARFSPDGRWIGLRAFNPPTANRIVVIPFQSDLAPREDQWISIADATSFLDKPRWSPDGNLLYFTSDRDGFRCIRAQRLDPTTKRPVGQPQDVYHSHGARRCLMNAGIRFLEISLSHDKLVFNLGEITGNIWMAKLPS